MLYIPFATVFLFVFGAIIGSFLNVVILRMRTGRGLGGRSMCFSCGKILRARELVPIASFLLLRGKCARCRERIALQYPLVEALTGILFMLSGMYANLVTDTLWQWLLYFSFYVAVFSTFLIIAVYDIRHKIIPSGPLYFLVILSLFAPLFSTATGTYFSSPWIDHVVAALVLAAPFAGIWFASRGRLMGFGDAKLVFCIGLLLGLSSGVAAILLAFWIGAVFGVILLLLRKYTLTIKSELPFAPFLALGAALTLFFHIDIARLSLLFSWF
ncbi:MAG: prepilin peptidase [Candidatus Pacebacteria bacterium]|nr:prepilin peptidase [Candidatus Paceibacterota bacterium]